MATTFDQVLATANNTVTNIIDAWGRVQVARLDAQTQPPIPAPQTNLDALFSNSGNSNTVMLIAGGVALLAVAFLVLKK